MRAMGVAYKPEDKIGQWLYKIGQCTSCSKAALALLYPDSGRRSGGQSSSWNSSDGAHTNIPAGESAIQE